MSPAGTAPEAPSGPLREAEALFFVEDLDTPEIDDRDLHHLVDVLRLRVGARVALGDGAGRWRDATIRALPVSAHRSRARSGRSGDLQLELEGEIASVSRPKPELTVGFALPKGNRLELVVQKLTELGIDHIAPLITRRTVVRLKEDERSRRSSRLVAIAREACSQSRRLHFPTISDPEDLGEFLSRAPKETVFAEPGGGALSFGATSVVIGPEGGWDEGELPEGASCVGFGPTVLRVETAAIMAGVLLSAFRAGVVGDG